MSDLSSDVFSSDLVWLCVVVTKRTVDLRSSPINIHDPRIIQPIALDPTSSTHPTHAQRRRSHRGALVMRLTTTPIKLLLAVSEKIGRATCRERGCQYV